MAESNTRSLLYILLVLTLCVSLSADWVQPGQITAVPFSYALLFLYALRTFLCCAAAAAVFDRDRSGHRTLFQLLCCIPPVLYGVLVLCGVPFSVLVCYARIVFCTAIGVCVLFLYTRFRRQTDSTSSGEALQGLSRREQDVANLLLQGKTTGEIAAALFISNATVKTHIQNIFRKYGVRNRMEFAGKIHAHTEG